MSLQVRRKQTQRAHPRDELLREAALAVTLHHDRPHFFVNKPARSVPGGALLIGQELFDPVVIQRGHGNALAPAPALKGLLLPRIGLRDDNADRVLIESFEAAFALKVFEVAADRAIFRELRKLVVRD